MPEIALRQWHQGQTDIIANRARLTVVRAGRRFGKSVMLEDVACNFGAKGYPVGFFAPDYKKLMPSYKECKRILRPIIKSASKIDAVIELTNGGQIDFWTLQDEDAGRGRKYKEVIIDEGSLVKKGMQAIWEQSIEPTLLDYDGNAIMGGTPKGIDEDNFFYMACTDKSLGFKEFHAPTSANPNLNKKAVAELKNKKPPLVYQQEHLADFVDWSGSAFFQLDKMLDNGEPIDPPLYPQYIFAILDTATKTGKQHDGTAYTICAKYNHSKYPLVFLDWGIVQISGELLIDWLPQIYLNLESYAKELQARDGSIGALIEDKNSGTILIKQAQRAGYAAYPIDSKLTAMGKDERAISVSSYFWQGMIKLSKHAYNKTVRYKEVEKNHLVGQICGYRVGVDNGADDLNDCATYSAAVALGDSDGF